MAAMVMVDAEEYRNLKKRVANIEVALMAFNALTVDLLPPAWQESLGTVGSDLFAASSSLGGFKHAGFTSKDD